MDTVRAWFAEWPAANIGCRPGPSGFFVADIDNADGEQVAQELGLLAQPTLTALSCRKCEHIGLEEV